MGGREGERGLVLLLTDARSGRFSYRRPDRPEPTASVGPCSEQPATGRASLSFNVTLTELVSQVRG